MLDKSLFELATDSTVRGILRRLAEVEGDELQELQEELGWKHNPDSWLVDDDLAIKAISVTAWDWMHCLVEGGSSERECSTLVPELERSDGLGFPCFDEYFQSFKWPSGCASA